MYLISATCAMLYHFTLFVFFSSPMATSLWWIKIINTQKNEYQFTGEFPLSLRRRQCRYDGSNPELIVCNDLASGNSSDTRRLERQKADKWLYQHQWRHLANVTGNSAAERKTTKLIRTQTVFRQWIIHFVMRRIAYARFRCPTT